MIKKEWTYKGRVINSIDDMPEDTVGFVYLTTHLITKKKYIGKKSIYAVRRRKVAGKKNRRVTTRESDWKSYAGSSEELKEMIKNDTVPENWRKEILYFCETKTQMSYYETKEQFLRDVLMSNEYLNKNILGKFYSDGKRKKTP